MKSTFIVQKFYSPDSDVATADAKTDNSKLATTDTVYVSPDGGTTDEAFPKPNVDYSFCVDVTNAAKENSGAFYVRFTLDNGTGGSGNQDFDFKQDAGLDAGQSVKAVVDFGQFKDEDVNYTLSASIYAPSAPEKALNTAGTFGFNPHSNNSSSSSTGSSDDTTAAGNSDTGDTDDSGENSNDDDTTASATSSSDSSDASSDSSN